MKVIVTGSRDYCDRATVRQALIDIGATSVVEGGARGADRLARLCALELGIPCITVPADWDTHGRAAGSIRNQAMLDAHPDAPVVLAFPLAHSIGTFDMCRRSKLAGRAVVPHVPDPAIHAPNSRYENGYYPASL